MRPPFRSFVVSAAIAGTALLGCAGPPSSDDAGRGRTSAYAEASGGAKSTGEASTPREPSPSSSPVSRAEARLSPTEGNDVSGTVTFEPVKDGVRVAVALEGLSPGAHGFHVHETGDCSAPDATSAGGHYAPEGNPHGPRDASPEQRHVGDLGNVTASDDGSVDTSFVDPVLALEGERSIVGKAVIVHAGKDDLESQPTGAAGARVACGVIEEVEG